MTINDDDLFIYFFRKYIFAQSEGLSMHKIHKIKYSDYNAVFSSRKIINFR